MRLMKIMKLGIIFLGSNFQVATSFRTGSEETILQSIVTRVLQFDGGNTWPSSENVAYQFGIIIPETSTYAFATFRRIRSSQTS